MKTFINGWTKESFLERLEQKNGFKQIIEDFENGKQCVYRNSEGNACAAGAFIPDDFPYLEEILNENANIVGTIAEFPELKDLMPLEINDMLQLQYIHDNRFNWSKEAVEDFINADFPTSS